MVRLSGWLLNLAKPSKAKPVSSFQGEHGKRWYQTKHAKVNIAWAVLVIGSLGLFVIVRQDAVRKRQEQMRIRKEIRDQVTKEQDEELAVAAAAAAKKEQ